MTFGERLASAMRARGPLCVGIDPHAPTLAAWGLPDDPDGLLAFSEALLEAASETAAVVKPNAAFYERHGSAGVAVLEKTLSRAREYGLLSIIDAKRGDIGSTMRGYAEAFLAPGSPLEADALTASPYLGVGSLAPAFELAADHGKGVFVLALTSNPEGPEVQHARGAEGEAVAARVAREVGALNAGAQPMGSIGLVVGATVGTAVQDLGIDLASVNGPLLSPGVGAQGAGPEEVAAVFGDARHLVLVNQSRGIAASGPDIQSLRAAIRTATEAASAALGLEHAR